MLDKRLVEEGKQVWGYIIVTLGTGIAIALLAVLQAWFFAKVVGEVFIERAILASVWKPLYILLVILVIRAILQWVGEIYAHEAAAHIKTSLRDRLLSHIVLLGPTYIKGERSGELIATIVEGVDSLEEYFTKYIPQLLLATMIPLLVLGFVMPLDWQTGLILLITGPLIPIFMILIGKLAQRKSLLQWQSLSWMNAHFLDVLQGITTLKVFNRAKDQTRVIERVSESFRKSTLGVLRIAFLSALVLEFIATISTAIVAVSIGLRLVNGTFSYTSGLFLLLLAPEFYTPLRNLGTNFHAGLSGVNASKRIFEILDISTLNSQDKGILDVQSYEENSPEGKDSGTTPTADTLSSDFLIVFKQVSLTYKSDEVPALKEINLSIRKGAQIALVGPSGAGKSSIAQLLMRFMEPSNGKILVNEYPLYSISASHWRKQISYIPQNPYLFAGSIMENISLGRPTATSQEVQTAAQEAFAHDFIVGFRNGYETRLGEGGARLSGGQAQRIAIARAFLNNTPLIILDEATSNLDPESEDAIQKALKRLIRGKTVLMIAHRLSTVQQVEQILVMNQGQIMEQGDHDQLMGQRGLYYRLVTEYRGERSEEPDLVN